MIIDKVEYRALAATTSELLWISQLLKELHITTTSLSTLYCDNDVAIHIASNLMFHGRTKHIELDCHFVLNYITRAIVKLLPSELTYK